MLDDKQPWKDLIFRLALKTGNLETEEHVLHIVNSYFVTTANTNSENIDDYRQPFEYKKTGFTSKISRYLNVIK